MIRVLVGDALPLLADSLAMALATFPQLEVVEERPTNAPAVIQAAARTRPDVAVVDYWMSDVEGTALTRAIIAEVPNIKIMLLSWLTGPEQIVRAFEAGAVAFLPKDMSVAQLVTAIERVHSQDGGLLGENLAPMIEARDSAMSELAAQFRELSPREVQIVALVNLGLSTRQIGNKLSISEKTVRNHISRILVKTDSRSQTELLARARSCGFLRG